MNGIRQHISELRIRVLRVSVIVVIIMVLILTFHINIFEYKGINLAYPTIEPFNNIAIQIIDHLKIKLIPKDVQLIQTAPGQAFFVQIYISLLVGVIIGTPIITKESIDFLKPALNKHEFNMICTISLPATVLFISGCCFAYFFTIPYLLEFLYKYGHYAGIITFLNVTDFVIFILQFLLAFGISFELPLIMYITNKIGITDRRFWSKNIRYAVIIIVIFGAIITPDGSGITMWFISIPMIILYLIGMRITE